MRYNKKLDNAVITLVFLFLFLPIFVLVLFSFNTSKLNIVFEGFTLHWYSDLFQNKILLEALGNTLLVAFVSTGISTIIGTVSAYAIDRFDFPLKKIINDILYVPVVIPDIVLGIALLSMYSILKLELGMFTLILAHISFSIPYVIISVRSVLSGLDPNIEKAASDLGASRFVIFKDITLPALMPGVISGAQLALTLSMDDVVISYFTAGPESNTLPLQIYSMIKTGVTPDVNALITILLLIILVILFVSTVLSIKSMKRSGME